MAQNKNRNRKSNNGRNHDVLGITLIVISAFLLLCIVIKPILGVFSEAIFGVMLGVFGIAAYPLLLGILILGVFVLTHRTVARVSTKTLICTVFLVLCSLIILQLASTHSFLKGSFSDYIGDTYAAKYSVGGVIMGVIAFGLKSLITEIACYIVFSLAIIVLVIIMTDAISRIKNRSANTKQKSIPSEPTVPEYSGMSSGLPAQRVIAAAPQSGLFVSTIEPTSIGIQVESGRSSDIPTDTRRNVSDYAKSPVIERDTAVDEDRSAAAKFKLYGDADAIKKQSVAEYKRASELSEPDIVDAEDKKYVRQQSYATAEPYVRVNNDAHVSAENRADADNMPRRLDYDGTPDNLHELYFPLEKHLEFNDDGIMNAEADEIHTRLEEQNEARMRRDLEIIEGGRSGGGGFGEPPVFDMPTAPSKLEPVETIIDASAPLVDALNSALGQISSEDKTVRAAEEQTVFQEPKVYPLETDKFKPDDIIDAFEVRERHSVAPESAVEHVEEEDEREEIMDGSNPQSPLVAPNKTEYAMPDSAESRILSDDILDGSLIISSAPAIDMSERHDNVSDLISGEDLSGMYITAEDEEKQEVSKPAPKRQKGNSPLENQISIESVLREKAEESVVASDVRRYKKYNYAPPPIDLLKVYESQDASPDELNTNKQILEQVVSRFLKVQVTVTNIVPGPQVTRYEIDVPSGTSVKGIEGLAVDIAYELACGSVRVEAPIPNKRAVGVEIPNKSKSIVGLRDIVNSATFNKPKSPLVFSVGKDLGGDIIVCDLEKIPHLLIAGQTGSGKSAGLNSLIVSLLYKASPEDLRFILIDPKRVEFSKYRGMPHLLFEKTISEPNDALNALKWAAGEMERRYTVLQKYACSKLAEYNALPEVASGKIDKLPHIVVIIDELATLMGSQVSGEIEAKISSIAALARAAGIHLIVATQRPSADVITGTIKANLTSRIAFAVKDATNSRIIIDEVGAEALRGNGDMLFYPQDAMAPRRVQGSFVDGPEILSVVGYLKEHYECDFDLEAENFVCNSSNGSSGGGMSGGNNDDGPGIDPLAQRIMAHAIRSKQISTSVIQRRFSIGYARAARIIDSMEDSGYIGPSTGNNKPRDVLMTAEQYKEIFGHDPDES